jgi:mannose-6-phosphate isomerase-like protein (cupin superfamily)
MMYSYVNSGQLAVKMDDQSEPVTLVAGDAAKVPPGHVAYVVGNEPVDMIEFASGAQ